MDSSIKAIGATTMIVLDSIHNLLMLELCPDFTASSGRIQIVGCASNHASSTHKILYQCSVCSRNGREKAWTRLFEVNFSPSRFAVFLLFSQ
jgi:hypothetical protein